MRRYIFMILCSLCACCAMGQDRVLVVHKSDKTTKKIPLYKRANLQFFYLPEKVDNSYSRLEITDISATSVSAQIEGLASGYESGVCLSTKPGVSIENNERLEYWKYGWGYKEEAGKVLANNEAGVMRKMPIKDLNYGTTYYCRSFVKYLGWVFYSDEHSFTTEKPIDIVVSDVSDFREWYAGTNINTVPYADGKVVLPTSAAWNDFVGRHSESFAGIDSSAVAKLLLVDEWLSWLTTEKVDILSEKCDSTIECTGSKILVLNHIDDDFFDSLVFNGVKIYGNEVMESDEYTKLLAECVQVDCSEEWGVQGNKYWKFLPSSSSVNPVVTYEFPTCLLTGKTYRLKVTMAPDTDAEETALANIFRLKYFNAVSLFTSTGRAVSPSVNFVNEEGSRNFTSDANKCTTFTFEFTPTVFGKNALQLQSYVTTAQVRDGIFTRTLRVANICVEPVE